VSQPVKGLGRRTVRGIRWTLLGQIIANVLRIVVVAVLGRLLSADEFGIVAAAMIVIFFGRLLRDVGTGLALVQRREITREHIEATFGFSLVLGALLATSIFAFADPLASALRKPESADAIRVLAGLFLIRAVAATSQALSQRDLDFRALAIVEIVSYSIGAATSIGFALAGFGEWSLIIGYLVETTIDSGMLLWFRPPPRPRLRWAPLRELLGFGSGQTASHIANYFANQGDYIVVGRFMDTATLGIYTRAYELVRFPATVFTNVVGKVLFPAFAKLQDDPERLGQAFRRVLFANAVLLLPASAGLVVLAPEAVHILLGPGWEGVVVPFQIMAVSMLWRTSYKAAAIVARSAGDVAAIAMWQVVYAVLVVGGAIVSVRWGIAGVATTTALAVFLHFTNLTRVALRQVPIGWGAIVKAHLDGLMIAALSLALALPATYALRAFDLRPIVVAPIAIIAGLVLPLLYVAWRVRRRAPDWTWLVDRLRRLGHGEKRQPSV
jgi:PST family polysaccharide transporter